MSKIYQKNIPEVKNPVKRNFGGFTLIELLVVVLIIGILAAIALPQYRIAVEKSYAAEAFNVLKSMKNSFDLYRMANGTDEVPSLDELDIEVPGEDIDEGGITCRRTKYFRYCLLPNGNPHARRIQQDGVTTYTLAYYYIDNFQNGIWTCQANEKNMSICKSLGGQEKCQGNDSCLILP